jgi:rhodanese-related sulfurtransferase
MNILKASLEILFAAVLIFLCGCSDRTSTGTSGQYNGIAENIDAQKAYELIGGNEQNPDFIILDIRTPQEYSGGHIEGAENIDYYSDDFRESLDRLGRDKEYLIYCRSGSRSANAFRLMKQMNFMKVYNLSNGIISWIRKKYPLIK